LRRSAGGVGAPALEATGGRDIAVFSKGNIQRLVAALAESHRLSLPTRYQVDYIETLYGLVRSKLAVAITRSSIPRISGSPAQGGSSSTTGLARTVALMRAPQALPPLIESCFTLMADTLRTKRPDTSLQRDGALLAR
jgi:hypothetical protein